MAKTLIERIESLGKEQNKWAQEKAQAQERLAVCETNITRIDGAVAVCNSMIAEQCAEDNGYTAEEWDALPQEAKDPIFQKWLGETYPEALPGGKKPIDLKPIDGGKEPAQEPADEPEGEEG